MSYPDRLIPKRELVLLDGHQQHGRRFIRHFECEPGKQIDDYVDSNNIIDPKSVADPKKRVVDYSVNLNGDFLPEDVKFEIIQNEHLYHADWETGRDGIKPNEEDYHINDDRTPLFFFVEDLYQFESLQIDGKKIEVRIEHKPVNCNYWHFTLNWLCDEEILQESKKRGLLGKIRLLLQQAVRPPRPRDERT